MYPKSHKALSVDFLKGLAIFYILLDGLDLWGSSHDPPRLGHFACSLLPYMTPVSPFFIFGPLLPLVHTQCLGTPDEQAISAILFMFKLTLAFAMPIPLLLAIYFYNREQLTTLRTAHFTFYRTNGLAKGLRKSFVDIFGTLTVCLVVAELWVIDTPDNYPTNINRKITDDFITIFVFMLAAAVVQRASVFLSCMLQSRSKHERK